MTMSGRSDPTVTNLQQNVLAEVLLDGTPIAATITVGEDLNHSTGTVTGWGLSLSIPVTVTANVSHTLQLDWMVTGNITGNIYCEQSSAPNFAHRTITALEY